MNLSKFIVVVFGPWTVEGLYEKEDEESVRKDFAEEYPDLVVYPAEGYDRDKLAGAIMQFIENELENANRHSINGCQNYIYKHLVTNGVDKFLAAEAIYEGFRELF